jgi:hypothetical protein
MNSDKNPESDGFERLAEAIEDLTEAIREGNSKHDIARAMRDTLIVPDHRVPPYAVLHLPAVCIVSIPEHFLAGQSQPVSAIKRVRLST